MINKNLTSKQLLDSMKHLKKFGVNLTDDQRNKLIVKNLAQNLIAQDFKLGKYKS